MWTSDHSHIHVAGVDSDGLELTALARGTLKAQIFGGELIIVVDVHESAKIIKPGVVTRLALFDHCGNRHSKTHSLDQPVEVNPSKWISNTMYFNDVQITITINE